MTDDRPPDHITRKTIVLDVPGADAVAVRQDIEIPTPRGTVLADVYAAQMRPGQTEALHPAVVLVSGYPDEGMKRLMDCRFKEMGSSTSWARAMAASGLTAVTYANIDPAASLDDVLRHLSTTGSALGIDGARLGLWASSGHVPVALSRLASSASPRVRCLAACYGYVMDLDGRTEVADAARQFRFHTPLERQGIDALATDVPVFVARAGQDQLPGLNASLDRFISKALAANWPLTVVNHPTGPHAFDLLDDSDTSRDLIRQTLAFLERSLS